MTKTIVVTGANRGLGACVVRALVASPEAYKIIATSRANVLPSDLPADKKGSVVSYALDVADPASIKAFADKLGNEVGKIDVLLNNAGVALTGEMTTDLAKKTLDVNYRGLVQLTKAITPLIKEGGRVVNVASAMSKYFMQQASPDFKKLLTDPSVKSMDALDKFVAQYEASIKNKTTEKEGFGPQDKGVNAYSFSKAVVIKATAILANDYPHLLVNSCCPGWCDTDMGASAGGKPPKTPEDGARILINVAVKDIGSTTGRFFENPTADGTGEGAPADWPGF